MSRRERSNGKFGSAVIAVVVSVAPLLMAGPALGEANFDQGVRYYQQRNYKAAINSFNNALHVNPADPNPVYYAALCHQALGDTQKAKSLYIAVITHNRNSEAARLSAAALVRLDPAFVRQVSNMALGGGGGGAAARYAAQSGAAGSVRNYQTRPSGGGGDQLIAPNETHVRYEGSQSLAQIQATVNGRSTTMYFDTGAAFTCFGMNHLQEMGLPLPTGKSTGTSSGVGSTGSNEVWDMRVDLRVGSIERKNYEIRVQKTLNTRPLLGQTFFRDLQYTIHPESHEILFVKQNSGNTAGGVPFQREGVHLIVTADINGHMMPMIFDTGASSCSFTRQQAESIGLRADPDAPIMQVQGVSGFTNARSVSINRMKLGPMDKSGVVASIVDDAAMPHPLLGQTFFGDWQYTIDNQKNMIYFLRR